MDAVAGAGGAFGQLAVGIAGGIGGSDAGTMPGFSNAANKLGKIGQKPTIDSLPDKVRQTIYLLLCMHEYANCQHLNTKFCFFGGLFSLKMLKFLQNRPKKFLGSSWTIIFTV